MVLQAGKIEENRFFINFLSTIDFCVAYEVLVSLVFLKPFRWVCPSTLPTLLLFQAKIKNEFCQ